LAEKSQTVIYEVNLNVDIDVIEPFDQWLNQHTAEMLAIPGFISAATSIPNVDDETQKHRCIQYRLSDQTALDDYLNKYAEQMRAKADLAFKGKFTASRRVLSVAEAALAEQGTCANCGTELTGRFCAVCGQREEARVPSIRAVTSEFTNEVFVVESKLWRSFHLLLLKPGQLTSIYLSGMRQKYVSPLRLYLLFSILTFTLLASLNSQDELIVNIETNPSVDITTNAKGRTLDTGVELKESLEFSSGFFSDKVNAQIEKKIETVITSIKSDIEAGNKQAVLSKFMKPLPKALFLFLPFVALLFKILYLGSGKYYVEHLIYVLHNHAFLFSVIIFTTMVSQVTRLWPMLETSIALVLTLVFSLYAYRYLRDFLLEKFSNSRVKATLYALVIAGSLSLLLSLTVSNGISIPLGLLWNLYVPYYIYRSLRVVYQRSPWATIPSLIVISIMYLFLLAIMLLSSAVFVGYTYS
jgi:hypothetical protein